MLDHDRLLSAYHRVRDELLAERTPEGHWVGELSSSALSTATALSALALVQRHGATLSPLAGEARGDGESNETPPLTLALSPEGRGDTRAGDAATFERLKTTGLRWLAEQQNADGGWGDTDKSRSNIATTMLVRAAIVLCEASDEHAEALRRAEAYITAQGDIAALRRRYGQDKTFAVPILANCALAGLVPWREVSALPFEAACLPQSWYRFAQLPVVSYAIPALVAIGQAKFVHDPPRNPIARLVRRLSVRRTLRVLERMQPTSGGFLEATPLTSFVVMSLAGSGRADHPVTRLGVKFLLDSAREDGSWPIDTNLATWVTTLAVNALDLVDGPWIGSVAAWITSCQQGVNNQVLSYLDAPKAMWPIVWLVRRISGRWRHPFTGSASGGWGWSNLSGAVPDVDDTAGALYAMRRCSIALFKDYNARQPQWQSDDETTSHPFEVTLTFAIVGEPIGYEWLLNLQNRNGGWPTFCRGWGKLPFDRSGTDLTAHVLRAMNWRHFPDGSNGNRKINRAVRRGLAYLTTTQRPDGSWVPLWFGNQQEADEENPIYGTARVLLAYRDLNLMTSEPARRGVAYLIDKQNADGGWGGGPMLERGIAVGPNRSSVEETALAVEALLAGLGGQAASGTPTPSTDQSPQTADSSLQRAISEGLRWLVEAVEAGRHRECSPIGLYFAKLWYYERLYPLVFTVSALRHAVEKSPPRPES